MGSITAQDIGEYLATDDDFDFELSIHRALRDQGLVTSHGGTYSDPVERKIRQFDLRTSLEFGRLGWGLNIPIEFKRLSAEFPLVVSRVPRAVHESRHFLIRSWGRAAMGERFAESVLVDKGLLFYGTGLPVGKHTFQLRKEGQRNFKTGDRETYDKWSQALASAADLIDWAREGHLSYNKTEFLTMVLPILVVSDGTLWAVDYDEDGKRADAKSVDECTLWVERVYPLPLSSTSTHVITHLHIYTRQGLLAFLKKLLAPGSPEVERIFKGATR